MKTIINRLEEKKPKRLIFITLGRLKFASPQF